MLKKILWTIATVVAVLGFIGMIYDFASGSPDLEVRVRNIEGFNLMNQKSWVVIKNVGKTPIRILDMSINDREECSKYPDVIFEEAQKNSFNEEEKHRAWVFGVDTDMKTLFVTIHPNPISIKVGDSVSWPGYCGIARIRIKTDQGSNTYEFSNSR